jgi:hypothetical protein
MPCRMCISAAVLILTGCFSYVEVPLETVQTGTDVRVYLTRQGLAELPEVLEDNGPYLKGTLVRQEAERVFIRVPLAPRQQGFYTSTVGQDVCVPAGEIARLQQRTLDRTGTALLVAGTAAAGAAVLFLIMETFGGPDSVDPPEPELRLRLLTLPVR